jgi:predicted nucleotidyltransferase
VTTIAESSLTEPERRVVERFVELLTEHLGDDLRSVWIYGSRARGEKPREESDVDLLVVSSRGDSLFDLAPVWELLEQAADAEGQSPYWFSPALYTPERLAQRREIRSFFIQEVDRDKIVLYGEP